MALEHSVRHRFKISTSDHKNSGLRSNLKHLEVVREVGLEVDVLVVHVLVQKVDYAHHFRVFLKDEDLFGNGEGFTIEFFTRKLFGLGHPSVHLDLVVIDLGRRAISRDLLSLFASFDVLEDLGVLQLLTAPRAIKSEDLHKLENPVVYLDRNRSLIALGALPLIGLRLDAVATVQDAALLVIALFAFAYYILANLANEVVDQWVDRSRLEIRLVHYNLVIH